LCIGKANNYIIIDFKKEMDDDRDFKARIDKAAKNYRLLKRTDVFERNRKNTREELSYLKVLPLE
jgi:hypothetical protein